MALKPEDSSGGFQHGNVVAFINEKMAGHTKGPEFYLENISQSCEDVENKLKAILEDSAVSSEAKDACAWSSLALGVRFARRQGQLHGHRVHWLQDFAKLHKSTAETLASDLKELTAQQEIERREAAFRLQQTQANLAEIRKERDLLRWKLLRAVRLPQLGPCPLSWPYLLAPLPHHPQNGSQPCLLLCRSWSLRGSGCRLQRSQAWPLPVTLGQKEQVRRKRRGLPLLMLLLLVPQEEEEDRKVKKRQRPQRTLVEALCMFLELSRKIIPLVGRGREMSGQWIQPCFISLGR